MSTRIFSNATEVINSLESFKTKLNKTEVKTPNDVAKFGESIARRLAPEKRGDLRTNIRKKTIKGGAKIISTVNKSFPYHLWVNEEPSYKNVRIFGNRPRTYRSTRHTGTPGYFNVTAEILRRLFEKRLSLNINKAIQEVK